MQLTVNRSLMFSARPSNATLKPSASSSGEKKPRARVRVRSIPSSTYCTSCSAWIASDADLAAILLQHLGRESGACQMLAEPVMKILSQAPSFAIRHLRDFPIEPLPLSHLAL